MNFDLNKLMQDPMFAAGIGLLGGASPRNAPMLTAYKLMQDQSRLADQRAESQAMQEHRRAVTNNEREQNRIYELQIKQQQRNLDMQERQRLQGENITRQFLERHGYAGFGAPENPVSPGAATEPVTPPPTPPRPINYTGSPEKVASQMTPASEAKLLAALLKGDPTAQLSGISEALVSDLSQRRQLEQDERAREAAERAARGEQRAVEAAERAARAEGRAEARFTRLENNATVRAAGGTRAAASTTGKPPTATELKQRDKEKKAEEAVRNIDKIIGDLRSNYSDLAKSSGGITDPERTGLAGTIDNVRAGAESSLVGQMVGKVVGTKNQSLRNKIAMTRPLLLQAVVQASEMGVRQIDNVKEFEMYLKAATDPSLDIKANLDALNRLQELYGSGVKASDRDPPSQRQASGAVTPLPGLPQGWKVEVEQ